MSFTSTLETRQSFQLKGSLFTLSVLQLQESDLERLEQDLSEKVRLAPKFFQYAPVVVDLQLLQNSQQDINFEQLRKILTEFKLVPVGIRGGNKSLHDAAQQAGFAVMIDPTVNSKNRTRDTELKPTEKPEIREPVMEVGSRLITTPIRSGQQVYAQGGDLVIAASVSPGAELLADGNIHVYGTLRGRALAGINGNSRARIFCYRLEAELVSIAGQYKVFEEHPHRDEGPKQLYLQNGQLIISPL